MGHRATKPSNCRANNLKLGGVPLLPILPLEVGRNFRVIAHRGASGYAPENTRAAFQLAKTLGAREIELDVQFAKDREVIICHDRVLNRCGYPDVTIPESNLDELLSLDVGSWYSPHFYRGEPLLPFSDLLNTFHDNFVYHVEIKTPAPGLVPAVMNQLEAHGLRDNFILTSFFLDPLVEGITLASKLRAGWLLREESFNVGNIDRAARAGFFQICPHEHDVDRDIVAHAQRTLPEVRSHSVKSHDDLLRVVKSGCNGLTINWPDWLRRI